MRIPRGRISGVGFWLSFYQQGLHTFIGVQSLLLRNCGYVAVIHGDGASVAGEEEGRNFIFTFCVYYNDMMRKNGIWNILEVKE